MAKILSCEEMGFDCDYICAQTEEELYNRSAIYAKVSPTFGEIPGEFRERIRSAMRDVDHC